MKPITQTLIVLRNLGNTLFIEHEDSLNDNKAIVDNNIQYPRHITSGGREQIQRANHNQYVAVSASHLFDTVLPCVEPL